MTAPSTDCLLLKTEAPWVPQTDTRWAMAMGQHLGAVTQLQSVSTAKAENLRPMTHIYLQLQSPQALGEDLLETAQQLWHQLSGQAAEVSRLHCVMRLPGASASAQPGVHYVVETDPEDGWQDEIFRWYEVEHMPGLASVPGTVLARRYLNLDHAPHSLACYDLTEKSVLGSPPWLAVRGTAWSDICRPHFTNTLRTMFETLHRA